MTGVQTCALPIYETVNPSDSTTYVIPTLTTPAGGHLSGGLGDYFGLPVGIAGYAHSILPFRAYALIWNEWYRDQNLQNSVVIDHGDGGSETINSYVLLPRNKRHDYFTSCLPWAQKGTAVSIPLGSTAPVVAKGTTSPQLSSSVNTNVNLLS